MRCHEFREQWDDPGFVAGSAAQDHLQACPDCRSWQSDMTTIDRTIHGLPRLHPTPGFEARVWRRWAAGNRAERLRVFNPESLTAGLVVAAAVFMLLMPVTTWSALLGPALSAISDLTLPLRLRAAAMIPFQAPDLAPVLSLTISVRWLMVVLVIGAGIMHQGLNRVTRSRRTMSWS